VSKVHLAGRPSFAIVEGFWDMRDQIIPYTKSTIGLGVPIAVMNDARIGLGGAASRKKTGLCGNI
jgi:hypothetical protein